MYTTSSPFGEEKKEAREEKKEKEEGEGQRDRLSQIVGIFVGISSFVWEFCREFGHFQIPKIPNFFGDFHKSRWGFRQSLMMKQEMMKKNDHISPEKNNQIDCIINS